MIGTSPLVSQLKNNKEESTQNLEQQNLNALLGLKMNKSKNQNVQNKFNFGAMS